MTRPLILVGAVGLIAITLAAGFGLGRWMPKSASPATADGHKALYWYDPMVPTQHFDKPGKSPFMDMQLVPKYAGEAGAAAASSGVAIDPAQAQSLGIRYATVSKTQLGEAITAPAVIDFNQRDLAIVQARTGGFVQRVYARAPGDVVAAGAPFADVLVPEWAGAQTEFLAVLHTQDAGLIAASRQRLGLLGMSQAAIAEVENAGKAKTVTTITTPTGGVIRTLSVRAGMTLTAGQTLAEVNGLGTVWVNASVPATLVTTLKPGQPAQVTVDGDGARPISGKVTAILPEVSGDSRSLQVRVELPNPGGRLRPGGFATVAFTSPARPALTVPSEAVIRTGQRALVMVALPGGRFQAAEVQLGAESGDRTEVLSGLTEGEKVVASGQFLIDSEANLSGVKARTAMPMAMADKSAANPASATYETTGRIERLDAASITLSHAPVPAIGWPAMTMTFHLPDPALGKGFKVGDQVRFSFARPNEGPTIRTITKSDAQ
jgi:Cu(I)/Ag(I) efflux system membrane fusion protein